MDWNRPIPPLAAVGAWKTLPIVECGEPLVPLGSFSSYPQIATSAIYAGERSDSPYDSGALSGSLQTMFVREGVAQRLLHAQSLLPERHMLLVYDSYRTLEAQQALFDAHVERRVRAGEPREFVMEDAQRFVSIPSRDPTRPPPHFTGGAVDFTVIRFEPEIWGELKALTAIVTQPETAHNGPAIFDAEMRRIKLIRTKSIRLVMGTRFDAVQEQTATRYYEERACTSSKERRYRFNRRLRHNVMVAAGFSSYAEEHWHFDYGNQFHMARTGEPAIYGPTALSEDNLRFEHMRCGHHVGCRIMAAGTPAPGKLAPPPPYELVKR